MEKIKRFLFLAHLALLKFRLCYAVHVVNRVSARYHGWLSRAFQTLSKWDCQYKDEARRYFAAGKEPQ